MSAPPRLLVTGTDTGVGKTLVTAALAAALSERRRVAVFKPAETGCPVDDDGGLRPADAVVLRAAARSDAPLELVCPYRYAEPLAPWIAAERAGSAIDPRRLRESFARLATASDVVLVESAGGLLVPLRRGYSFAELAADLALPILLVVGSRLGAINATLLTLECARRRGLRVTGWVLNELTPTADLTQKTNGSALERLTDVPCLGRVPYVAGGAEALLADLASIGKPVAQRLGLSS